MKGSVCWEKVDRWEGLKMWAVEMMLGHWSLLLLSTVLSADSNWFSNLPNQTELPSFPFAPALLYCSSSLSAGRPEKRVSDARFGWSVENFLFLRSLSLFLSLIFSFLYRLAALVFLNSAFLCHRFLTFSIFLFYFCTFSRPRWWR